MQRPIMNQTETINERQLSPAELIDESNTRFYERFPFPWRPAKFDFLVDPDFQTVMFNQNIGDWEGHTLPEKPSIWVAGCGTNSALITALTFPKATVDRKSTRLNSSHSQISYAVFCLKKKKKKKKKKIN